MSQIGEMWREDKQHYLDVRRSATIKSVKKLLLNASIEYTVIDESTGHIKIEGYDIWWYKPAIRNNLDNKFTWGIVSLKKVISEIAKARIENEIKNNNEKLDL